MTTETAIAPRGAHAIDRGVLPTTEVVARVHRIQEVMRTLMKEGTHYGTIPGTPKPTLFKPGAELLLMAFRIAASPAQVEDLCTPDEARYRVIVRGTHQLTSEMVGEMIGECSSSESKYRWIRPVCDQEWDDTDPTLRREKWMKGKDKPYKVRQIRSSPADVANTILKMATKRALIAMTLVSLGASDIFAQDLEDLTDELRETIATESPEKKAPVQQPQRNGETTTKRAEPAAETSRETTAAAFDPAASYTLKRIWQPNADKPYRFLELVDAKGAVFTVHTWDTKVVAALEGHEGQAVRVAGKASNFDRAPYQVQKAELVSGEREPGIEG